MSGSATVAFERILRRLQLLVGHGRITTGSDAGNVQVQQMEMNDREIQDDVPRVAEYGFTSMPKPGCQAILVYVAGERSNGVILGTNDETSRLKGLQPGEVALYDDQGQSIWLTRAGIVINGAGLPISFVNTPSITHNGVNIGATHKHPDAQGGTTGTPE